MRGHAFSRRLLTYFVWKKEEYNVCETCSDTRPLAPAQGWATNIVIIYTTLSLVSYTSIEEATKECYDIENRVKAAVVVNETGVYPQ